mgnify:CR=1 FL=1
MGRIISQIKDLKSKYRKDSLHYFIYNTLPGTTSAAAEKAQFLKEIVLGQTHVEEISVSFAFELLSHMKGGPSINVLLDIALEHSGATSLEAAEVLKTQVFLYEADMERLANAYRKGNKIARDVLESYSNAEFFTKLPDIDEEINVAEEEIKALRKTSHDKINKIAIETSTDLIKQLIGEDVNNSSISAIVEDLSRKNKDSQHGV